MTALAVKFWGTRGSIACPGPKTRRYGGNTSCIEVRAGEELCILDAGTGIRELGLQTIREQKYKHINLFISHTHWDHIQGLPFFVPIYSPAFSMDIYGPPPLDGTLEDVVLQQMQYKYFPVRGAELAAKLTFHELNKETVDLGPIQVSTNPMNHPIPVLAYRIAHEGKSVVYTGDNEQYVDIFLDTKLPDTQFIARANFIKQRNDSVFDFVRQTDLLIADSQYTDEEYKQKPGWGHCSLSHVLDMARNGQVKQLAMFHHEPTHDDAFLDSMQADARRRMGRGKKFPKVFMAKEGQTILL